jgi:hypothetical protein
VAFAAWRSLDRPISEPVAISPHALPPKPGTLPYSAPAAQIEARDGESAERAEVHREPRARVASRRQFPSGILPNSAPPRTPRAEESTATLTSEFAPLPPSAEVPPAFAPVPNRRLEIEPRQRSIFPVWSNFPAQQKPPTVALDLAPGVREPIALLDAGAELPPPQAAALAGISNEFIDRIEEAADTLPDDALAETWDTQQAQADSEYRNLFGAAAYNQMLMEAAIKAMGR